ncbi:MAG: VWA domain-containing protein [Acidobacteriota bacterium]
MRHALFLGLMLALTTAAASAQPSVILLQPEPGQPVFGEIEVVADVVSEHEVERVTFWLDDVMVEELRRPPYRVQVEITDNSREHRFEVVVEDVRGGQGKALLVSPKLDIDFELELELQQLYVTVSRRDERVLGLSADQFVVIDNGEVQDLVTFERGDVPLTALLLLDASESMLGDRLAAAVAGAKSFIDGMQELDQAKLLLFADRILHDSPFTNFAEVLATGLEGIEARGSTALNDHLYLALRLLEPRQGRRVIILLSDGIDVSSVLRMNEVMRSVRRSQALIYWLRLGAGRSTGGQSSAWRSAEEHAREFELLERSVEESGGRILALADISETAAAFDDILSELRDQYVLGYYPSQSSGDGSWHQVRVRVGERSLKVRTRQGYVDF